MTFKELLKEEFLTYFSNSQIYKNPTKDELREFQKEEIAFLKENGLLDSYFGTVSGELEVRFMAFADTKELYLFSVTLMHYKVMEKVLKKEKSHNNSKVFYGLAKYNVRQNNLKYVESLDWDIRGVSSKELKEMLKTDWSFLNKYFINYEKIPKEIREFAKDVREYHKEDKLEW
jgi:hypothetical protein